MQLDLKITMKSDWRIGTGKGASAHVDAGILRDAHGLPYLPAKTVTGILRDACEQVAMALDGVNDHNTSGSWCIRLRRLFGDKNQAAAISIRPAVLCKCARDALLDPDWGAERRAALVIPKPGIKVDAASGTASGEMLRIVEFVRGGTVLKTAISPSAAAGLELDKFDAALLWAGCETVRWLGGDRRRGGGTCSFSLATTPLTDEPLEVLRSVVTAASSEPANPAVADTEHSVDAHRAGPPTNGTWVDIDLEVDLKLPVCVPKRVLANVTESLDYVPGGLLLPIVARAWRGLGDMPAALAADAIPLWASVPEIDGERCRPVPMVLRVGKDQAPFESGAMSNPLVDEASTPPEPDKQLRSGWLAGEPDSLRFASRPSDMTYRVHNTIEDSLQRPHASVGGLYTNEAIAAGTKLRGRVRIRRDQTGASPDELAKRLGPEAAIGSAKKDDYGKVGISASVVESADPPYPDLDGGQLSVWCESDVIVLNDRLVAEPTLAALGNMLEPLLGVRLEPAPDRSVIRTSRRDRFNAGWSRPQTTQAAIQAGSVAIFDVAGTPTEQSFSAVADGIGERTAEGYGRVVLNDSLLLQPGTALVATFRELGARKLGEASLQCEAAAGGGMSKWVSSIDRAVLRAEIDRAVVSMFTGSDGSPDSPGDDVDVTTRSQMGALRQAVRDLADDYAEENSLTTWIAGVRASDLRTERWGDKGRYLDGLERLAGASASVGDVLEFAPTDFADVRPEHWSYAVRSLITTAVQTHRLDLLTRRALAVSTSGGAR